MVTLVGSPAQTPEFASNFATSVWVTLGKSRASL